MEIQEKLEQNKGTIKLIYKLLKLIAILLVIVSAISYILGNDFMRKNDQNQNVISFTGHGEVSAVPDIANISFTISKEAKTVKEAQDEVAKIENKVLSFLRENKIADKDFKTSNASFYPKYEYRYEKTVMPCNQYGCPQPAGKNVISGYVSSETITVKVRNTDDVGKIAQGLGALEVSDFSGPNFEVDNQDALKADARKKAIDDAKLKAKVLAKDLGIKLGKISSFSENANYPMPMYAKSMMASGDRVMMESVAEMPKGENTISSDVTIVYEIK